MVFSLESESWFRMNFLISTFALSIYVSVAMIWDLMMDSSNALSGKFPSTITAGLTAAMHFFLLNSGSTALFNIFGLSLLKNNYSFWTLKYLNSKNKKSLFEIKFFMFGFYMFHFFCSIFVFLLGFALKSLVKQDAYYFNQWFGLAGLLIFPAVSMFTSMVYVPNWTYKLFFSV